MGTMFLGFLGCITGMYIIQVNGLPWMLAVAAATWQQGHCSVFLFLLFPSCNGRYGIPFVTKIPTCKITRWLVSFFYTTSWKLTQRRVSATLSIQNHACKTRKRQEKREGKKEWVHLLVLTPTLTLTLTLLPLTICPRSYFGWPALLYSLMKMSYLLTGYMFITLWYRIVISTTHLLSEIQVSDMNSYLSCMCVVRYAHQGMLPTMT